MQVPNAYDMLGVAGDATDVAVRAAYRRAVSAAHPDKVRATQRAAVAKGGVLRRWLCQGGSPATFAAVRDAYATLAGAARNAHVAHAALRAECHQTRSCAPPTTRLCATSGWTELGVALLGRLGGC